MARELSQVELDILTSKSKADKAINSLKGILLGINLDRKVNEKEVDELVSWSHRHRDMINRNPFKEFMTIIRASVSNNIPTTESIQDLFWLCQKYEADNYYYNAITADLQTLQGICHGILADGKVNDKEIYELDKWLENNEHLSSYYPYDEIRSIILSVLSDGKIDDKERLMLKAYLNQFVNLTNNDISDKVDLEVSEVNISGHCTSNPDIYFDGKKFCLTGVLKIGTRSEVQSIISDFGGVPKTNITKDTDYLIVGDNGNSAWAFSCYGRKVEKAISLRKEGHKISIIHEFDFLDAIEELK